MTGSCKHRKELGILPRKRTEKDFSLWFEMTKQHRLPEYLPHDWLVRSEEALFNFFCAGPIVTADDNFFKYGIRNY